MIILKVCILAVVGAVCLLLVKNNAPVISSVLRIGMIVFLVVGVLPEIKNLLAVLNEFNYIDGISKESIKILLKSFSVLALGSVCADICRDNGEGALAGVVELGVKFVAVGLSVPVITAVLTVATAFVNR